MMCIVYKIREDQNICPFCWQKKKKKIEINEFIQFVKSSEGTPMHYYISINFLNTTVT